MKGEGKIDVTAELENPYDDGSGGAAADAPLAAVAAARDLNELNDVRVRYLGKKGMLTARLKELGALPPEERKVAGQAINRDKQTLEAALAERRAELERAAVDAQLAGESLDVTLPGTRPAGGGLHLLTLVTNRLLDVFTSLGYEVVTGPELETDHYNFGALNFPPEHPARDTQDTFWTTDGRLLRTHTSPMQVRYMETHEPPFKVVVPGKVFRNEALVSDFTSVPATIDKWVKLNAATATPRKVLSVDGARCERHDGPAPVQLCVTEDGGHSWPGGNKPRGESPSTAISANDVMWEFFSGLPTRR